MKRKLYFGSELTDICTFVLIILYRDFLQDTPIGINEWTTLLVYQSSSQLQEANQSGIPKLINSKTFIKGFFVHALVFEIFPLPYKTSVCYTCRANLSFDSVTKSVLSLHRFAK